MNKLLLSFAGILILTLISFACAAQLFCVNVPGNSCDLAIFDEAEVGVPTLLGYIVSLSLFALGWKITAKTKEDWLRIVLRSGLLASAFTPSVVSDPAVVFVFVVPAWIPAVAYAVYPPAALAVGGLPISVVWLVFLFVGSARV